MGALVSGGSSTLFVSHPTAPAKIGMVQYCHHRVQNRRAAAEQASVIAARCLPLRHSLVTDHAGSPTDSICSTTASKPGMRLDIPSTAATAAPIIAGRVRLALAPPSRASPSLCSSAAAIISGEATR
eukprot:scaffold297931_cov27-Tisochrysis_lutea.AAC.2